MTEFFYRLSALNAPDGGSCEGKQAAPCWRRPGHSREAKQGSGVRCLVHLVKTRDRLVWLFHGILIFQHLSTIQLSLALACFPNNEGGIRFNWLHSNRYAALPDPIILLPGDDEPGIKG